MAQEVVICDDFERTVRCCYLVVLNEISVLWSTGVSIGPGSS